MPCPIALTQIDALTAALEAMETGQAHYDKAHYWALVEDRNRLMFENGQAELAALFAVNPIYLGEHDFLRGVLTGEKTAEEVLELVAYLDEGQADMTLSDYLTATVRPQAQPHAVVMLGNRYAFALNRAYCTFHLFRLS